MEAVYEGDKSPQEEHMERLAADIELRREYMLKQAMIRSLERENEIA